MLRADQASPEPIGTFSDHMGFRGGYRSLILGGGFLTLGVPPSSSPSVWWPRSAGRYFSIEHAIGTKVAAIRRPDQKKLNPWRYTDPYPLGQNSKGQQLRCHVVGSR